MDELLDVENPENTSARRTRDFLVGAGITLAVFLVFLLAQNLLILQVWADGAGLDIFSGEAWKMLGSSNGMADLMALTENGDIVSHVSLYGGLLGVGTLFALLMLWRSRRTKDVLGINGFSAKHGGLFLVLFFAVVALQQFIASAAGVEVDFMEKVMSTVTNKPFMLLGVGIMAPLFEELWLRGVAYWSIERVSDSHMAILITSVAFALLHIQYPWPIIVGIIPLGLILGYARSVSGSIILPILLHVANNCASVLLYDYF